LTDNSRRSDHVGNTVFSILFLLMFAIFVILFDQQNKLARVVSASDDDIPATLTFTPTVTATPYMFTATPRPTSTVPANFIVIDDANPAYPGSSLALNPLGIPVIAYMKRFTPGLALARCNTALTCDAPVITTIDDNATSPVKLVLDGDIPIFTFVDADQDLKVARCQDAACTTSILKTIESVGYMGEFAIALDQNQLPVILYTQTVSYVCDPSICVDNLLKFARCNNTTCDNPTITQIVTYPSLTGISLAIDDNNYAFITYSQGWQYVRLAICNNTSCTNKLVKSLETTGSGYYSSIQMDSNGIPVIAYQMGGELRLAYCNNKVTCDVPTISIIDNFQLEGDFVSLALDSGNLPIMAYYDYYRSDLKLARCTDPTCMGVEIPILDSTGFVGSGTSLVMSSGKPFISYINQSTGKVMLYIENKPSTITPTATLTPSLTPTSTSTPITPTSPPNSTPAPAFFATHHPTLTWNSVTWAWGYQIEIDDDPAFGSPFTAEIEVNTLTYTVESALTNGEYYWHVRAKKNATDGGVWSATETIVISAP
jgi:hypothetical protein